MSPFYQTFSPPLPSSHSLSVLSLDGASPKEGSFPGLRLLPSPRPVQGHSVGPRNVLNFSLLGR